MSPTPDRAAVVPLPPALASPVLAETERARLGHELENYLAPLAAYCEAQQTDDHLSVPDFRHGYEVRQALDAFIRYEQQTEQLLGLLRTALAYAQQLALGQVPSLEEALRLLPADRTSDPLYRLGWVRGYCQSVRHYERLNRIQRHLDSPEAHAYAALPLAVRQAIDSLHPANLRPDEPGQIAA